MAALLGIIAFAAFIAVTIGPICYAILAWKLASSRKYGWSINLLFVPVLLGLEWLGTDVLFKASGDTGDGPPGLGLLLIPGLGVLLLTVVIYYIAVAIRSVHSLRTRSAFPSSRLTSR